MVRINFDIETADHLILQNKIGRGNVSAYLKKCIRRVVETYDGSELEALERKSDILKERKDKADAEYFEVVSQIETIKEQERIKELRAIEARDKERQRDLKEAIREVDAVKASGILEEIDFG